MKYTTIMSKHKPELSQIRDVQNIQTNSHLEEACVTSLFGYKLVFWFTCLSAVVLLCTARHDMFGL